MATLRENLEKWKLEYLRNVRVRTGDIFKETAGTKRAIEETAGIYEKNALNILDSSEIDTAKSNLVEEIPWLEEGIMELAENVLFADGLLSREYSTSILDRGKDTKEAVENGHRAILRLVEHHDAKAVMHHIAGLYKSLREMEDDLTYSAENRKRPLKNPEVLKTYFDNGKTQLNELYSKVWHLMSAVHTARAVLGYSTPDEALPVEPKVEWK